MTILTAFELPCSLEQLQIGVSYIKLAGHLTILLQFCFDFLGTHGLAFSLSGVPKPDFLNKICENAKKPGQEPGPTYAWHRREYTGPGIKKRPAILGIPPTPMPMIILK